MKRMWIDSRALGPRGVQVFRYGWSSERADGLAETRLLFDAEGKLIGVDYDPIRPGPDGGDRDDA